jgi:hypothetical protein
MLARILVGIIISCSISVESKADRFETGNSLYRRCVNTLSKHDNIFCHAYLIGVADALHSKSKLSNVCIPDSVLTGHVKQVVIEFISINPKMRHYSAEKLAEFAISQAFPCHSE